MVHGRGGHGGQPHRSADPVVAAAHVVTALQTVVAREVSPLQSAVVTLGLHPRRPGLQRDPRRGDDHRHASARFDDELRRSMPERIRRIASGVAEGLRCRAEVEVKRRQPRGRQRLRQSRRSRAARRSRVVGEANVVEPEPTMGGEDMAVYFERVPGCFVFVGSANPARGLDQPHHSPRFDFDEDALGIGCEFLVQAAEEALSQEGPSKDRGSAQGRRHSSRQLRGPLDALATRSRGRCPAARAPRSSPSFETVTGGSTRSSAK